MKAFFARHAVGLTAQPHHHRSKGPVVHVNDPFPKYVARVNTHAVAMMNMIIYQRREQVVSFFHGSKVTRKMQVDIFHGNDLCVATTAGPTFYTRNTGTQRGVSRNYQLPAFCQLRVKPSFEAYANRWVFPSPAGVGVIAVTRINDFCASCPRRYISMESWPCSGHKVPNLLRRYPIQWQFPYGFGRMLRAISISGSGIKLFS